MANRTIDILDCTLHFFTYESAAGIIPLCRIETDVEINEGDHIDIINTDRFACPWTTKVDGQSGYTAWISSIYDELLGRRIVYCSNLDDKFFKITNDGYTYYFNFKIHDGMTDDEVNEYAYGYYIAGPGNELGVDTYVSPVPCHCAVYSTTTKKYLCYSHAPSSHDYKYMQALLWCPDTKLYGIKARGNFVTANQFGSYILDPNALTGLISGFSMSFDVVIIDDIQTQVAELFKKSVDLKDPDDPYDGGDDKGDDDNNPGDYDHTSDPVPEPDLPSVSVTDSGLVTLFAPTESQLKSLADYLWSDAFSLDNFKKMLNNPMDCILGLTIIPVNVPHGSAREITVGNIVTTVSCDICPTQYVKVDCGTFTFNRHDMTNSYLDYSPYSKCYLYLPFIGVQEINIDDFMQSTMHVVYHVDILTGAMFCYVMRDSSVMYTYMGQCAENVPLSSSSYSNTIGSIMSAAASIVGVASVAATGGASAPVAAGLLAGASTSTANAVTSLKPSVAHSGSIGGGAGIMGVNYPYLIFNTPHVSIPSQQRHYTGYPSNQIVKLSALSGFNVIQAINLSVSGANDSEMNEIESILKGGVIL